ncbi:hypothetical protein FNV43_RR04449 [Rhamnella rubrinervis]|uniref:Uncharacterized protein n=1 Tax=Rhamnella rubrinervis TaxID=2594499 RepID=A0A8K0HJK3_9ROSA|nr:hypothetical protein FNV43_RR04449 [Rhamnella rubrinervis]
MSSWKSLLLRIGDKCPEYGTSSDFKDHIETCFGVLRRELEHSPNDILSFLLQCAEQLPHKIPFYGTVVTYKMLFLLHLEVAEYIEVSVLAFIWFQALEYFIRGNILDMVVKLETREGLRARFVNMWKITLLGKRIPEKSLKIYVAGPSLFFEVQPMVDGVG